MNRYIYHTIKAQDPLNTSIIAQSLTVTPNRFAAMGRHHHQHHHPSGGSSNRTRSDATRKHSSSGHPKTTDDLDNPRGKKYREKDLSSALCRNARSLRRRSSGTRNNLDPYLRPCILFQSRSERSGLDQQSPSKTYHDDSNGHRQGFSTPGYFIIKPYISLNSYVSHDDGTTGFVARSTISTLLHEMVHVFLALYSCQCTDCQRHTISRNGISGQSGHGPNWANAMNAIEEAFQDDVQWEVEGGMLESLALEMATSGWVPRDDQLERWGIDPHELLSVAEEIEPADLGGTGCQVIWLCDVM